jgi:hypothetical protein
VSFLSIRIRIRIRIRNHIHVHDDRVVSVDGCINWMVG